MTFTNLSSHFPSTSLHVPPTRPPFPLILLSSSPLLSLLQLTFPISHHSPSSQFTHYTFPPPLLPSVSTHSSSSPPVPLPPSHHLPQYLLSPSHLPPPFSFVIR